MKVFKILLLIFLSFLMVVQNFSYTYARDVFSGIETQINPDSSSQKIEKLQRFFEALGLYHGEVTGNYEDIEDELITYQIQKGIVKDKEDWGAGYFGRKTLLALEDDFPDTFEEYTQKYLPHEEVETGERSFVITAYYSPLSNQKKYITGTYYGDIKLNGSGKVTASGKGVFPGLLAAPKNYEFGTKIYFEGIGVGVVEDRGGAIVNAGDKGHEADRIDIWMGYGDEGLSRALNWGQRTVEGEVLEDFFPYNVTFDESILSSYYPIKLSPVTSTKEQVQSMQRLFETLGYYNGNIDGLYSSIKDVVIDFQLQNGLISSKNADDSGYIGPKTRSFLEKKYPAGIFKSQNKYSLSQNQIYEMNQLSQKLHDALVLKSKREGISLSSYNKQIINAITNAISKTQNVLKKLKLQYLKDNLK